MARTERTRTPGTRGAGTPEGLSTEDEARQLTAHRRGIQLPLHGAVVELRHTGELVEGDVVLNHGMRLRLGPVVEVSPERLGESTRRHGPCWRSTAEVLNVPELEAAAASDPSSDAAFILSRLAEHPDTWAVQGNRLARWTVELPGRVR